jgi:hypothetical protein
MRIVFLCLHVGMYIPDGTYICFTPVFVYKSEFWWQKLFLSWQKGFLCMKVNFVFRIGFCQLIIIRYHFCCSKPTFVHTKVNFVYKIVRVPLGALYVIPIGFSHYVCIVWVQPWSPSLNHWGKCDARNCSYRHPKMEVTESCKKYFHRFLYN